MKDFQGRIDQKSFESAKLYYKIEDYKAAVYALKNALKENPDNIFREDIMYYIVAASYQYASNSYPEKQRERFLALIDHYYNFVSEFPDSKYRTEVEKMFQKAQQVTNIK
jgi:outer membrane protein assembly factor BamD